MKKYLLTALAVLLLVCVSATKINAYDSTIESSTNADSFSLKIVEIPTIDPVIKKAKFLSDNEVNVITYNKITNELRINNNVIKPNWWPGNPNPQPSTEDWFFQHMDYGGNAPSGIAKACAVEAFNNTYINTMSSAVVAWAAGGAFSLSVFAATFGFSYVMDYAKCMYRHGVR